MISFKGLRVTLAGKDNPFKRVGTVIAENEDCVGIRFDGMDVPAIVRKTHVSVIVDDK